MRKDEVKEENKEEATVTPTQKIIIEKEVKVNLIKKDLKQEVKRIKKTKVEGQTEEKKRFVCVFIVNKVQQNNRLVPIVYRELTFSN